MIINSINYEAFALDYLEGTLPPAVREEMELFLKKHPAIAKEIEEMKGFVVMEKTKVVYPNKKKLLKRNNEEPKRLSFYWRIASAAAVFLLMMTFYFTLPNKQNSKLADAYVQETNPATVVEKKEKLIKTPTNSTEEKPSRQPTSEANNIKEEMPIQQVVATSAVKEELSQETIKHSIPLNPKEFSPPISTNIDHIASVETKLSEPAINIPKSKETIAISLLPSLHSKELDRNNSFNLPTKKLQEQSLLDAVASTSSNGKNFKSLLGKLPFKVEKSSLGKLSIKVEKSSFIPSYFQEESAGQ